MSCISGNCNRCCELILRPFCDGSRERCTKILLDAIEVRNEKIKTQQQEIENLKYTLIGVMHSVDKWLDDTDGMDEVNRAAKAREVALQAIETLEQENEQLRAQVARMRDALIIANHRMPDVGQFCACGKCKTCGADINYVGYEHCVKCARVIIDEALSDTPADYHNPADVEALKQAREALAKVTYIEDTLPDPDWNQKEQVYDAIRIIDTLLGGE